MNVPSAPALPNGIAEKIIVRNARRVEVVFKSGLAENPILEEEKKKGEAVGGILGQGVGNGGGGGTPAGSTSTGTSPSAGDHLHSLTQAWVATLLSLVES